MSVHALKTETRSASIVKDALLRAYPALLEDEQALADTLEGETDLTAAVAAVVGSVLDDETMAAAIGERVKALNERKKRFEERADAKRAALLDALEVAGRRKLELPEATVSVTAGTASAVITDDLAAVQAGYGDMVPKVDKTAVKNALKDGATLTFATLSNGAPRLTIRKV